MGSAASAFLSVQYPNEDVAHVVSLAVDRNNEPWINIRPGTTFHLSHGTWTNEDQKIGKNKGILGAMVEANDGMVWIAFGTGHTGNRAGWLVGWDGSTFQKYSFVEGRFDISVATMAARGDHVWLAGGGGIVLFTHGRFYFMEFNDPNLPAAYRELLRRKRVTSGQTVFQESHTSRPTNWLAGSKIRHPRLPQII